jgi:hypothetical protein
MPITIQDDDSDEDLNVEFNGIVEPITIQDDDDYLDV